MPTPNAAAGCWRAGCWRRARVAAAGSACSTRPASTSSWRGWRPRASARSRCPSAPSRRRSSCVTCSPAPTSTCCSVCPRTAATTTWPGCTTRWARTSRARAVADGAVPAARLAGGGVRHAGGARRPGAGRGARRGRGRRHPGRPDGHRAHLGFDQRPEGRAAPARVAPRPPREPEPAARPRPGGAPVLQLAHVLGRWARLQHRRRARRRRHPPVLGLARPGRDARLHRARTTRAHERVRRVDRRTGRAPELPHARLLVDPWWEPPPAAPRRHPARGPGAPAQHARHDRDRQRVPDGSGRDRPARRPARLVRPAGARARRAGRRPRHASRTSRRGWWASSGSGAPP